MKKVFLAGTRNESKWRDLIKSSAHFRVTSAPTAPTKPEEFGLETKERALADYVLAVITPKMTDYCEVLEAVNMSNKRPGRVIFVTLHVDGDNVFTSAQNQSLSFAKEILTKNGAHVFANLHDVLLFLNQK